MQELDGKVKGLDWVVSGKLQKPREGLETVVDLGAPEVSFGCQREEGG